MTGAIGQRAALLILHTYFVELPPQIRVLGFDAAQPDVAVPGAADIGHAGRESALRFGEDAERHLLEDRHSAFGIDLGGNEDDVADDDGEEQIPGAPADVEKCHRLGSIDPINLLRSSSID